jgi:hypothetical protein
MHVFWHQRFACGSFYAGKRPPAVAPVTIRRESLLGAEPSEA